MPVFSLISLHSSLSRSLSAGLLPPGIHFLLSIHMSVSPCAILSRQIYSGIRNEILPYFRLLNAFIQNEACEIDFHRGAVSTRESVNMQSQHSTWLLCRTRVAWPDLSDSRVNTWEGGSQTDINPRDSPSGWREEAVKAPSPPSLRSHSIMAHAPSSTPALIAAIFQFQQRGIKIKCFFFLPSWSICIIPSVLGSSQSSGLLHSQTMTGDTRPVSPVVHRPATAGSRHLIDTE